MSRQLTPATTLDCLRKEARRWLKALRAQDQAARARLDSAYPGAPAEPGLRDVQHALAREYGFSGWKALRDALADLALTARQHAERVASFVENACVPRDAWHATGTLERAEAILAAHPEVASSDIYTAAILGEDGAVRQFLQLNAGSATAKGGRYGWDALTYLCFSRYLRLDKGRSDGFVRAAEALLNAGASPNTGFYEQDHQPNPEFESALYGAAGVAHHPGLTRLLLDHGADPNDGEVTYHAPETFGNNEALKILVESGLLTQDSLNTMLLRKLDWTDYDAVVWLLEHGADPNHLAHWGRAALHHSLGRDNALRFLELLLDHGADPTLTTKAGETAFAIAARLGRADALDLFESRGFPVVLEGDLAFLAACARADEPQARTMVAADPALVQRLQSQDGGLLATFAGAGNSAAVRLMLDLGFDVNSRSADRRESGPTALHLAVWRERLPTVKLLLERGAEVEAANGRNETPLALAVRAMTERSEWTPHHSVEIVAALLAAGARPESVTRFPSGSAEADELLRKYGREA